MIATISHNGTLTIRALTELESFALTQWMKEYVEGESCDLVIEPFGQEMPEIVKKPTTVRGVSQNIIKNVDVNSDRKNSEGFLIPSDDIILSTLSKSSIPVTTKEVTELVKFEVGEEVQLHNVSNALERLYKSNTINKLTDLSPLKWFFKSKGGEAVSSDYATSLDRISFAKEIGYNTIDEAVSDIGSWEFEKQLKEHVNSK